MKVFEGSSGRRQSGMRVALPVMRRVIADRCETCGAAREAMAAARGLFVATGSGGAARGDENAVAYVAACRACWQVLGRREPGRERLRSQVRCVLAFTPGYAVWKASARDGVAGRCGTDWLCGQAAWRDAAMRPCPLPEGGPVFDTPATFDEVRRTVFAVIGGHGAPVHLTELLDALLADETGQSPRAQPP